MFPNYFYQPMIGFNYPAAVFAPPAYNPVPFTPPVYNPVPPTYKAVPPTYRPAQFGNQGSLSSYGDLYYSSAGSSVASSPPPTPLYQSAKPKAFPQPPVQDLVIRISDQPNVAKLVAIVKNAHKGQLPAAEFGKQFIVNFYKTLLTQNQTKWQTVFNEFYNNYEGIKNSQQQPVNSTIFSTTRSTKSVSTTAKAINPPTVVKTQMAPPSESTLYFRHVPANSQVNNTGKTKYALSLPTPKTRPAPAKEIAAKPAQQLPSAALDYNDWLDANIEHLGKKHGFFVAKQDAGPKVYYVPLHVDTRKDYDEYLESFKKSGPRASK